jgi:hypothetical protein
MRPSLGPEGVQHEGARRRRETPQRGGGTPPPVDVEREGASPGPKIPPRMGSGGDSSHAKRQYPRGRGGSSLANQDTPPKSAPPPKSVLVRPEGDRCGGGEPCHH